MLEYINNFLNNLVDTKKSEKTIKTYKFVLEKFYDFAGDTNPNDVTLEDFEHFLYDHKSEASSVNTYISAIKSFYNYMEDRNTISTNHDYKRIKFLKVSKKNIEFFDEKEISSLKRRLKISDLSLKVKTIVIFMVNTGIRNEELCNLKKRDIDLKTGRINIVKGKGDKDRVIYIRDGVTKLLKKYYDDSLFFDYNSEYVFPGIKGDRMSERELNRIFEKVSEAVEMHVYPHKLRHTFLTQLAKKGFALSLIAFWAGHESTRTTEKYIHVTANDMQNIARQITI